MSFENSCKTIDGEFDMIFGRRDENNVPAMLLRAAVKMVVMSYPSNRHRDLAVTDILSACTHLVHAEKESGSQAQELCRKGIIL